MLSSQPIILNVFPHTDGSSFINSPISVNVTAIAEDLKKRLKPSKIANHKYHREGANLRTACTEGTRERIIEEITAWAYDATPNSPTLCWVLGPAGFGKTTIAYTIAKRLETNPGPNGRKVIGGNFFCSHQFPETMLASRIIPTIVYQLALECPAFANALNHCGDFDTVYYDVKSQLEGLLIRPWTESQPSRLEDPSTPPYYIIVIDALDEIEGPNGSEFLRALLDVIEEHRLPGLKIFATSRPDPALVDRIGSFPDRNICRLEKVPANEAQGDIRRYLSTNLPNLRREFIEKLVDLADGLFIYAATIVRYLAGHQSLEQEELLDDLLSTRDSGIPPTSPEFATHPLDELYRRILDNAFRRCKPITRERRLRILHIILCTAERTSADVVAHFVRVADIDSSKPIKFYIEVVDDILQRLHAVLSFDSHNILWYHKSFPDFIFSRLRSEDFWCDETTLHRELTASCFRVMKEGLRFNIANIPSSCDLDVDNAILLEKFRHDIPRVLTYACHHWSDHLQFSATTSPDPDPLVGILEEFLQLRVLFWMEAMNLLKSRGLCDLMLRTAGGWVRKDTGVASKFADAATFAVYFAGSPASSSTPHLYISALATSPTRLGHWKSYFPGIPRFTGGSRQVDVGALLTIDAGNHVHAVVLSRDGRYIVSGSSNGLVQVWSASTGEQVRKLVGHSRSITSVAISTDGTRIVSGSDDHSIRVWNATTGDLLRTLEGHVESVTSIAFSTEGSRIVSGSNDKTVRVWNVRTGEELRSMEGQDDSVTSVAFSSDGTLIASGSYDGSVQVWDSTTGEQLKMLEGHRDSVTSVAFSHDGTCITSGSRDCSVRVWDSTTGEQLRTLVDHNLRDRSDVFSTDDRHIKTSSRERSVRVRNATCSEQLRQLDTYNNWVTSVAFSTDGTHIVSGSNDGSVRLWNATTGEQLRALEGHSDSVRSVVFSNDGTRVVSGSNDRSVRVWKVPTEELLRLGGHHDAVTSVAFSPDSTRVVSGSGDKTVRVWNAKTGEQLGC